MFREIKDSRAQGYVDPKSKISELTFSLDKFDILHVGGRIKLANVPSDAKHPIILPECHFSTLLLETIHRSELHAGLKLTLGTARQNFWIKMLGKA